MWGDEDEGAESDASGMADIPDSSEAEAGDAAGSAGDWEEEAGADDEDNGW